jgi:hypothetical protein
MTDHDERDPTSAEGPQDAVPTPPEGVPAQPGAAQQPASAQSGPTRGAMRYQDPATTVAREPTLGEQRAREQAKKREAEAADAAAAEEKRKRKKRKRILIGAGVTVGVAAVAAIGYAASQPEDVVARCVDANDVVVDDSNCLNGQEISNNSGYIGGGGFYPIFIGGGGSQYHYNYGGSGNIGQRASGGTTTVPNNTNVRTASGSSVSRGGFGVSKGGSSSGGSSSGGSSSGGSSSGGSSSGS